MSRSLFLICLLLAGPAFSTIAPAGALKRQFLMAEDIASVPLDHLVDTSAATKPLTTFSVAGNAVIGGAPFQKAIFPNDDVNFAKSLSPNLSVVITGHKTITVVEFEGMGKIKTQQNSYDVPLLATLKCTDAVLNAARKLVYVGCFSTNTVRTKGLYVFTVDLEAKEVSSTSMEQDGTHWVRNRLRMFIGTGTDDEKYLCVYDQRNSHVAEDPIGSGYMRLFRNVESRTLRYMGIVELADNPFNIIYDFFPYQSTVVLSGRVKIAPGKVALASCTFDPFAEEINCIQYKRTTQVTDGMVGITTGGDYFEVNKASSTGTVAIYKINGDFAAEDWNNELINGIDGVKMPDFTHEWITDFNGNQSVGVVSFGNLTGLAAGYSGIAWGAERLSYHVEKAAACVVGKTILSARNAVDPEGNTDIVVELARPNQKAFVIQAAEFVSGTSLTSLEVLDTDQKGEPFTYSTSTSVVVLKSLYNPIRVNKSFLSVTQQDLKVGESYEFGFSPDSIEYGNLLKLKAYSQNNSVVGSLKFTGDVDVSFDMPFLHKDVLNIAFTEGHALVEKADGYIYFFKCGTPDWKKMECVAAASFELQDSSSNTVTEFNSYERGLTAILCGSAGCRIIVTNNSTGFVYSKDLGANAVSAYSHPDSAESHYRVSSTDGKTVSVYLSSSLAAPEQWTLEATLDEADVPFDNFCPQSIIAGRTANEIAVVNDCNGEDQAVMHFLFEKTGTQFSGYTSFPRKFNSLFACPAGKALFGGSANLLTNGRIVQVEREDSLAHEYVPAELLGDPNVSDYFGYSCGNEFHPLIVNAYDTKQITVTVVAAQKDQASKYVSQFEVTATKVQSFDYDHGVIHWIYGDDESTFKVTFKNPKLVLKVGPTAKTGIERVHFDFSNGVQEGQKNTYSVVSTVNIVAA